MLVCGRASTLTPLDRIAKLVGARGPLPPWGPRYNQPPGELIPIVTQNDRQRAIEPALWGLSSRSGKRFINATAERLRAGKTFTRQRGLFFVDGFYEWDKENRQPYYIYATNRHPIPLGVIYRRAGDESSCAVITTAPNELVARVHNRMPAVIAKEAWDMWLDPAVTDPGTIGRVLEPISAEWFAMHEAPRTVNSPANDLPALIERDPIAAGQREAEIERQIRERFEREEFTTGDVARALNISDDEAEAVLQEMRGLDHRLAKWWFKKWER